MQIQKFRQSDSFIFITLKSLLLPKTMKRVLLAFESPHNHDLLIVDCKSISAKQYRDELWNPLYNIMEKNTNKKMILIIQGANDSAVEFENNYKLLPENDDDYDINSLEKSSQRELLQRNAVRFQGKEECFGRLFGTLDANNIECKKLTELARIINPKILIELIKNNAIRIGGDITGLSQTESSYYIPRKIVRHVVIKVDILKSSGMKDLYAIGGVNRATLTQLAGNETELRSFDDSSQKDYQSRVCFVLDHGHEADQFKVLCQRNADSNIHWVQGMSGKLIWKQSRGDVSNLVKYKDTNQGDLDDTKNEGKDYNDGLGATHLEEDDLVNFDKQQRIVILSDIAGMGKTTLLTYLRQEIKDKQPSSLVIIINLRLHTTVLQEEVRNRTFGSNNTDEAVDCLVDKLERLDTDLERKVYKTILKGDGEAALLFDGVDEISPTYGRIVHDLLQALVKLPIKKIIVTTRPHTSKALEKELGIFSYSLQPFSPENQIEFLKKFWKQGLGENYSHETLEKRLELHANRVIELLDKSVDRKMMDFTGVPLQTMMVAHIYWYFRTAQEDTSDKTVGITALEDIEVKLPEKIDIIDLYGKFVATKFKILFTQKQSGDSTDLVKISSCESDRLILSMQHQKFALDELFEKEIVSILLTSQLQVKVCIASLGKSNTDVQRTGIATLDSEGKPQFIHRTFAEYFAATFLMEILEDDSQNQQVRNFFVAELFVKTQYRTIRAFINCLLSEKIYAVENKSWNFDSRKHRDESGQTVYHVAATECNFEIVKFFLNRFGGHCKSDSEKPDTVIYLRHFSRSNLMALAIIIHGGYDLSVVKSFVEGGADIRWKNFSTGETLLHVSVTKSDNLAVVKYLYDEGANVNCEDTNNRTPLHLAVASPNCNLEVVKYLCDKGANVNCQDTYNWTPLYAAVSSANCNLEVVKYLCDKGANVNCEDTNDCTPLHLAVDSPNCNLEVVKYLCDKGANVNCEDTYDWTPLYAAVSSDNCNLGVVKYLCDKGANVNCEDTNNRTPLHSAVSSDNCNLEAVKYLCDKGANVNCEDINNRTPLHSAVSSLNRNLEVVKYLCDEGANVNTADRYGKNPLDLAVLCKHNDPALVEYLRSQVADHL